MSILTNRLQVKFDIEALKRDFVFIRFEKQTKQKQWIGSEQLDLLLSEDFSAFATMFEYGKFAYAMFNRPIDVHKLLTKLRQDELFADDAVTEVIPTDDQSNNSDCIRGAWLAQILLNSLASSRSRFTQYQFRNLTGALLIAIPNRKYLDVVKVWIDSKNWLLLSQPIRYRSLVDIRSELTKTTNPTRKKELGNALSKPYYRFEASTGTLIRHLTRDGNPDSKTTYVACGVTGTRVSLQFLEFSSLNAFKKSKAGILHEVLNLITEKLPSYMTVNLSQRDIENKCELKNLLIKDSKKVNVLLSNQQIHIVDRVNDADSIDMVEKLKNLIIDKIGLSSENITIGKKDKSKSLNFRIIHEEAYYDQQNKNDEYVRSDINTTRQNITIESLEEDSLNSIVITGIKELLIKQDINLHKFSLFEWSRLDLSGIWTFVMWDQDSENVVFIEIEPNGSFCFSEFDLLNWGKFEEYRAFMVDQKGKKLLNLDGLVISDDGDINQVFFTHEITVPNLNLIYNILEEIQQPFPRDISTGSTLSIVAKKFLESNTVLETDKFNIFLEELSKIGNQEIIKEKFYKLMANYLGASNKVNTKDATQLRDYFLDKHKVRFKFPQDNQNKEQLFSSSVDIKYFGETDREAYYFVGNSKASIQSSFKDSCHLRKIVAVGKDSKLVFSQLLSTMDVDFVRTGQSTVIPFPFKYIREYIEMNKANQ